jgi:hypothetical protein
MNEIRLENMSYGVISATYITTIRQETTISFDLGGLDGYPLITGVSSADPACTVTNTNGNYTHGNYTSIVSSMYLQNGEMKICRYELTYAADYACTGKCIDAPVITASGSASVPVSRRIGMLPVFAQIQLSETYDAFTDPNAGFVAHFFRVDTQSFPTLANRFGFPTGHAVPVYEIAGHVVSSSPIGNYTAPVTGTQMVFTLADDIDWTHLGAVNEEGFFTSTNAWAVPVFDSGYLLPTFDAVTAKLSTSSFTDYSLTISNGESITTHTATPPAMIVAENLFEVKIDFSTSHLDPLTAVVNLVSARASYVDCYDAHIDGNLLKFTTDGAEATVTIPTSIADTTTTPQTAVYSLLCKFVADPYTDGADPTSITFTVSRTAKALFTHVVDTPSAIAGPVPTTKLTIRVSSEVLLDNDAVFAILTKTANAFKNIDDDFDALRFLLVSQDLDLSDPYATTVTITAHLTDISVSLANAYATSANSHLAVLGYDTCTLESSAKDEIASECTTGCHGGPACGICVYGNECDVTGEGCKENGARKVAVAVSVVLSVMVLLSTF